MRSISPGSGNKILPQFRQRFMCRREKLRAKLGYFWFRVEPKAPLPPSPLSVIRKMYVSCWLFYLDWFSRRFVWVYPNIQEKTFRSSAFSCIYICIRPWWPIYKTVSKHPFAGWPRFSWHLVSSVCNNILHSFVAVFGARARACGMIHIIYECLWY